MIVKKYYWISFKEDVMKVVKPGQLINGGIYIVGHKQEIPIELFEMKERIKTPNTMKTIYIAGSYRWKGNRFVPPILGEFINILKAWKVAKDVWAAGFVAVCPHTNGAFMDRFGLSPEIFLKGDFSILHQCDGILMMPEWRQSTGARAEHDYAIEQGIPVYYSIDALKGGSNTWL